MEKAIYANTVARNNIMLGQTAGVDDPNSKITCFATGGDTGLTVANANLNYSSIFHDNWTDVPVFMDISGGDFHLKSMSPGLTSAVAVSEIVPWGAPISNGDSLGAFNYYSIGTEGDTTPPAPPSGVMIM
jgi:hypothetical protein